jgi:hypothetical protein
MLENNEQNPEGKNSNAILETLFGQALTTQGIMSK